MGGPGGGYQNVEMWQASVMGTSSMMGGQSYMSSYQAQALETVTTPAGTFANALHVREQRGASYVRDVWYAPGVGMVKMNDGTNAAVLTGYTIPGAVSQPGGGAPPLAFTPETGLWWNPNESGTGYNIQVQRGVLVATMYSYTTAGDPVWYLAVGPLTNAGDRVVAAGTLDRYRGGQCASCMYQKPSLIGQRWRHYLYVHIPHDRDRTTARRPRHPDSAGSVVGRVARARRHDNGIAGHHCQWRPEGH